MSVTSRLRGRFYEKGYYAGLAPEPRFDKVADIFGRLRGERLLDIGCGDGDITRLLKERARAKEAFGVDIAPEAVKAACGKGIEASKLDIDEAGLPFEDNYFDIVYCGEIIEHVFDPDHLLDEIHRVLKAEGTCVLTTPNLAGWPNRFVLLLGYQPYPTAVSPSHEGIGKLLARGAEGQWGHIRVLTLRALKELVSLHHFRVRYLVGAPVTVSTPAPGVLLAAVRFVDRVMSRVPSLATRVIAVIEKE
jgi:methionine biosynthesis protein MetW